jgi:hypothetical protein
MHKMVCEALLSPIRKKMDCSVYGVVVSPTDATIL